MFSLSSLSTYCATLGLAALGALPVMSASQAGVEDCKPVGISDICLQERGADSKYIRFTLTMSSNTWTHFNVRHRLLQWEVPAVGGNKSAEIKIPTHARGNYSIAAQACNRGSFSGQSLCSRWASFTVKGDQDAPKSDSSWAAIATDSKGRWGWAHSERSETGATTKAMGGCGAGCKVVNRGQNRCLAYAESRPGRWGTSIGPSLDYVTKNAVGGCAKSAPPSTCRILHSACG